MADVAYSENIRKLEHGVQLLKELANGRFGSNIRYKTEDGRCEGYALDVTEDYAIQFAEMPTGSVLNIHRHEEHEIIIIISGKLEQLSNKSTITKGQCHYFPPGCPHGYKALEDTKMLGITIPPSEDYPGVKR